jgi:hypothetical protein
MVFMYALAILWVACNFGTSLLAVVGVVMAVNRDQQVDLRERRLQLREQLSNSLVDEIRESLLTLERGRLQDGQIRRREEELRDKMVAILERKLREVCQRERIVRRREEQAALRDQRAAWCASNISSASSSITSSSSDVSMHSTIEIPVVDPAAAPPSPGRGDGQSAGTGGPVAPPRLRRAVAMVNLRELVARDLAGGEEQMFPSS